MRFTAARHPVAFIVAFLVALTAAAPDLAAQQEPPSAVVASTAWTGAFALAAGAQDVTILAPTTLRHPPEYELRPSDLRTIGDASLVVYAGYETMVPRLLDAVAAEDGARDGRALQIPTVHSRPVLESSIRAIAERLGTSAAAEENIAELFAFLDLWAGDVSRADLDTLPVLVHFHQRALAEAVGMNVVGVFGPAPLEARQIRDLSELEPALIVDNGHNPVAGPLEETTSAPVSVWFNFPGVSGTRTLQEIFELNYEEYLRSIE